LHPQNTGFLVPCCDNHGKIQVLILTETGVFLQGIIEDIFCFKAEQKGLVPKIA